MSISKLCADHLRSVHESDYGQKLKASHAREIVAAFFGYRSHAAQIAETDFPLSKIKEAAVMVPDVDRITQRIARLNDLPSNLPSAYELARILSDYLVDEDWFGGELWLYESVENYVTEVYLIEHEYRLLDELSGVMAETNAFFDEAYFDEVSVDRSGEGMTITATGTFSGSSDPDKMFAGDTIDMSAMIALDRVAGHTCFHEPDLSAGGAVNDDWYDPGEEPERPAAE